MDMRNDNAAFIETKYVRVGDHVLILLDVDKYYAVEVTELVADIRWGRPGIVGVDIGDGVEHRAFNEEIKRIYTCDCGKCVHCLADAARADEANLVAVVQ